MILALAPMSGVTDAPFRGLASRYGADITFSEMVASQAVLRRHADTLRRIAVSRDEISFAVQIFGSDPHIMCEAARSYVDKGVQMIDINAGCPVKKITRSGGGAALLKNERATGHLFETVVRAVNVPVTVKMRLGWDEQNRNGIAIARIAEQSGIQRITVHGRTRSQMYRGEANWSAIAEIKEEVAIPVIGNGDIRTPEDAARAVTHTNIDGIMIGRGALGRPWIFHQIKHFLSTGTHMPNPTMQERHDLVLQHFNDMIDHYGPEIGNRMARKHLAWHSRGLPGAAAFRKKIQASDLMNDAQCIRSVRRVITDFYLHL